MARTSPIRLRTVAATIVVVATGLIIFHSYQSIIGSSDETIQSVPLIKAETKPFRVVPENSGGVDIPGKDSTLFRMLDQNESDPLALSGAKINNDQHVLPNSKKLNDNTAQGFQLPEIPEPRSESLYGMIDDLKEADTKTEVFVESETVTSIEEQVEVTKEVQPLDKVSKEALKEKLKDMIVEQSTKTEAMAIVSPLPILKPAKSPKIIKAKVPTLNTTKQMQSATENIKSYYIQLASIRDEIAARNAYERISQNFPDLVENLGVEYPKADLGVRGVFTRIQIGPLPRLDAQKRCGLYAASPNGGTCLVISR
jgi:hypothetical protein